MSSYQDEPSFRSLVVEDHLISRRYLTEALRRCGWAVKHCCNAEEALTAYESWNPQLVITDLQLPGANGIELAEQLARTAGVGTSKITFLLITAHTSPELEQRACLAGFAGILRKPLDFRQFRRFLTGLAKGIDFRMDEGRKNGVAPAEAVPQSNEDLLKLFRTELRTLLPEIEKFLLSGQLTEAGSLTHQLTASAAICSNRPLEFHVRELNAVCRQPTDVHELAGTFTRLHRCARSVLEYPAPHGSG